MRWLAALITLILTVSLPVLGGFIWYLGVIPDPIETRQPDPGCDAVVVWTGGAGRIDAGADLLTHSSATNLFISGVGQSTNIADVRADLADDDRVKLGRQARSTLGNAFETASWLREKQVGSVCLVTSDYHMPRSLLLLRAEMPQLLIIAWPVASTEGRPAARAAFLWREYVKFAASHFAVETQTRTLLHDLAETAKGR